MLDFNDEIRKQVKAEIQAILDKFAEATETITQQSLNLEVHYKAQPEGTSTFNKYVDLIWAAYAAKFSTLMRNTISAVNCQDFLIFGLTGRSMIEHAAILRYYQKILIIPQYNKAIGTGIVNTHQLTELINLMDQHLRGGRFDWRSFHESDLNSLYNRRHSPLKQLRVGNCIKKWAEDYPSIIVLYDLFCDLVHPNLGSMFMVVRVWSEGTGIGGSRGRFYALDLLPSTIMGLLSVVEEVTNLMKELLLLRFPEIES